ncbi:amino acid ABC transporter permease [Homoserinibacter sp. YIM 151385]|uniref:amino acid ABC transporter permease n=1 Tax=Homoserinibacter sp. YIM 151385 TaxID=2985506 RepID=UPI0022F008D7|nr:amino acid ABC transporter permease [Homoserinibacter sp. YIM 151385]WBU38874.1 amino acid ABC transporter permease [Homoserinibacter sp. YIM 151385]
MDTVIAFLPQLGQAFLVTLRLLVVSALGAFVIGTVIAAMRISPVAAFRVFATGYTELIRNIPLTLVLFFCAFVLPYLGAETDYILLATIGLTVYTSPFIAEAVRSGVNGVAIGQAEAARAVGLSFGQTLTLVVLPQAVRMVIPPLINVVIALTKNTSVAAGFGVIEMVAQSRRIIQLQGDAIAVFISIALLYLLITIPLGRFADQLEKRVAVFR